MRQALLSLVGFGLVAACTGQTPPARDPLPAAGDIVPETLACGFLVGDGLGASVEDVVSGGASEGILESGDIVVTIDEAEITNAEDLRTALSEKTVGQQISIEVVRAGEPVSVAVVLGPSPDDPERPLLGVMIETSFERIDAITLEGEIEGGPLVRAVGVGTRLYLLNPETTLWGSLSAETPAAPWASVATGVFTMESPDTEEASLVDTLSRDRIVFDVADWRGSRVLGSLGDQVVVSATRPAPGEETLFQIALLLVNVESRNATWIWIVDDGDIGIPVATFPSPDGTRILVAGQVPEDDIIRYMILTSGGLVQTRPSELTGADNLVALGWFDDERVLLRDSAGALMLMDAATGLITPAVIPTGVGSVARGWAVGDGLNVLADTGSGLIRFEVDGSQEVRILADRCQIDQLGDIGWSG